MQLGLASVGGMKWTGVRWLRLGARLAYSGRARATEQVLTVQSGCLARVRGQTPQLSLPPALLPPASAFSGLSLAGS